jgi:transmembrane sensor
VSKKDFLKLLDKYLSGQASLDERNLLNKAYNTFQETDIDILGGLGDLDVLKNKAASDFLKKTGHSASTEQQAIIPEKTIFYQTALFRVAASLLVFWGTALIFWVNQHHYRSDFARIFANNNTANFISFYNRDKPVQKIRFPDGSFVELSKGSKIGFNKPFSPTKREVYLIGEGFFQVTKNHAKPFIVYTDKIVTKVLGTSFIVKSSLNNDPASVLVKTGKVAVFRRKNFTEADAAPDLTEGIILMPNHIVALNNKDEFEKKIPDNPQTIEPQADYSFDFKDTPIATVFARLEAAYGISITYDKIKMAKCSISVKMGNERFYEKLDLVCHTVNAVYVVRDGNVVVTSPGCGN